MLSLISSFLWKPGMGEVYDHPYLGVNQHRQLKNNYVFRDYDSINTTLLLAKSF